MIQLHNPGWVDVNAKEDILKTVGPHWLMEIPWKSMGTKPTFFKI